MSEGFKEKSKRTIEYMKIYYRRTLLIKKNIERIIQAYEINRTYVLFGKEKEIKEIIEGILKALRVKYITENDHEKIESTKVVLCWNIEDREKFEGLKCEFLMEECKDIFNKLIPFFSIYFYKLKLLKVKGSDSYKNSSYGLWRFPYLEILRFTGTR